MQYYEILLTLTSTTDVINICLRE